MSKRTKIGVGFLVVLAATLVILAKVGPGGYQILDGNFWYRGNVVVGGLTIGSAPTAGLVFGGGDDSSHILTTSAADNSFGLFYSKSTATTGTSRGLYWKHHLAMTTPSGEAARFYTMVDTAGANDAHGAHVSVGFGTNGTCAGESAALRSTFMVPNKTLGGTNAAAYTELWAEGTSSDFSNGQFQRYVLGGDATGALKIDASSVLFSVEGVTSGAGNIYYIHAPTTLAAGLKIKVVNADGVPVEYVLPLYTTE